MFPHGRNDRHHTHHHSHLSEYCSACCLTPPESVQCHRRQNDLFAIRARWTGKVNARWRCDRHYGQLPARRRNSLTGSVATTPSQSASVCGRFILSLWQSRLNNRTGRCVEATRLGAFDSERFTFRYRGDNTTSFGVSTDWKMPAVWTFCSALHMGRKDFA